MSAPRILYCLFSSFVHTWFVIADCRPTKKRKRASEDNSEAGDGAWVCYRNHGSDVVDKLINLTFHLDSLMVILSMPPTYPASDTGNISFVSTLDMNDIQSRFAHIVRNGAPTNDPCRVLPLTDFLCSARVLHTELLRQSIRVNQQAGNASALRGSQYPFTVDVALSRLPVRLFLRNYGMSSSLRTVITHQLLDKSFVTTEEISFEQRMLIHAVRTSRMSIDGLLKDENEAVRGSVQAKEHLYYF